MKRSTAHIQKDFGQPILCGKPRCTGDDICVTARGLTLRVNAYLRSGTDPYFVLCKRCKDRLSA